MPLDLESLNVAKSSKETHDSIVNPTRSTIYVTYSPALIYRIEIFVQATVSPIKSLVQVHFLSPLSLSLFFFKTQSEQHKLLPAA